MSIRSLLMPAISGWFLSEGRLEARRRRAERRRLARGLPHEVHYFHQVDDPYSALACQALADLEARYDIRLVPHLVSPPADNAAPDRPRLVAFSRRDAQALAERHGLDYEDPGHAPEPARVLACGLQLAGLLATGQFAAQAPALARRLWTPDPSMAAAAPGAHAGSLPTSAIGSDRATGLSQALAEGDRLRRQLGHYLGATFFYGGEWYWGIDRLHHLERRLQALGALKPGAAAGLAFPPDLLPELAPDRRAADHALPLRLTLGEELRPAPGEDPSPVVDVFLSLRSPCAAIALPRLFARARETGATLRMRFLLPMVMRGLPVPAEKRRYISLDAAREARLHGIPFGRINDPVGRPTERGLALLPWAHAQGQLEAYLLSFMRGVWAEGIDAGSDRGLARIVTRAGLRWDGARAALSDEGWREAAERNRQVLLALGLWGVPSFRIDEVATWGQDRLWQVREALRERETA